MIEIDLTGLMEPVYNIPITGVLVKGMAIGIETCGSRRSAGLMGSWHTLDWLQDMYHFTRQKIESYKSIISEGRFGTEWACAKAYLPRVEREVLVYERIYIPVYIFLEELHKKDPDIRYVKDPKNFGKLVEGPDLYLSSLNLSQRERFINNYSGVKYALLKNLGDYYTGYGTRVNHYKVICEDTGLIETLADGKSYQKIPGISGAKQGVSGIPISVKFPIVSLLNIHKMKASDSFKTIIDDHLKTVAAGDPLFAETLQKPGKNIEDCVTYILNKVKASGQCGFADEEIFGMAIHYYDEDNIKVGSKVTGRVVVNHHVEKEKKTSPKATEPGKKRQTTIINETDLFSVNYETEN